MEAVIFKELSVNPTVTGVVDVLNMLTWLLDILCWDLHTSNIIPYSKGLDVLPPVVETVKETPETISNNETDKITNTNAEIRPTIFNRFFYMRLVDVAFVL